MCKRVTWAVFRWAAAGFSFPDEGLATLSACADALATWLLGSCLPIEIALGKPRMFEMFLLRCRACSACIMWLHRIVDTIFLRAILRGVLPDVQLALLRRYFKHNAAWLAFLSRLQEQLWEPSRDYRSVLYYREANKT